MIQLTGLAALQQGSISYARSQFGLQEDKKQYHLYATAHDSRIFLV
jgi:hypothetical protein